MDGKELSPQPVSDSKETVNVVTLKSIEFDDFSIVDEYLSELDETLEVSSHELDITIALSTYDEVEKEIEVILEVSNELSSLKEGVHASLPKAIDVPFVVDISKGEGIM
ncbi:hypothetical protein Syun_018854 [Stephania yunnanensis]|uniref:Uncharacterized protein n=1 Tax=Stephania yunnanensis TaxID=152371 RepID=A0AAP0NVE2_9MAGN